MSHITDFHGVPKTLLMTAPTFPGSMPTMTRVKTVYTALGAVADNAAKSIVPDAAKTMAPTPLELPPHIANHLNDMYAITLKNAGPRWDIPEVSVLLKFFVGAAVVYGVSVGMHQLYKLKNNAPPGQKPKTWKQAVKHASKIASSAVRSNVTLAADLAKAHDDLERTSKREAKVSERLGHAEHTLRAIVDDPSLSAEVYALQWAKDWAVSDMNDAKEDLEIEKQKFAKLLT